MPARLPIVLPIEVMAFGIERPASVELERLLRPDGPREAFQPGEIFGAVLGWPHAFQIAQQDLRQSIVGQISARAGDELFAEPDLADAGGLLGYADSEAVDLPRALEIHMTGDEPEPRLVGRHTGHIAGHAQHTARPAIGTMIDAQPFDGL